MTVIAVFGGKASEVWPQVDAWYQTELAREIAQEQALIRESKGTQCQHCGHPGAVVQAEYVGGKGLVQMVLCEDRVACWKRWDDANLEGE